MIVVNGLNMSLFMEKFRLDSRSNTNLRFISFFLILSDFNLKHI